MPSPRLDSMNLGLTPVVPDLDARPVREPLAEYMRRGLAGSLCELLRTSWLAACLARGWSCRDANQVGNGHPGIPIPDKGLANQDDVGP